MDRSKRRSFQATRTRGTRDPVRPSGRLGALVRAALAVLPLSSLAVSLAVLSSLAVSDAPLPAGEPARSPEGIPRHQEEMIRAAAPERPRVAPKRERRVLIFSTPAHLMDKDPHKGYCVPYGACALRILGEKTGAYVPVPSDDLAHFAPDSIRTFDAIVLNNAAGDWIAPDERTAERLRALGDTPEAVEAALRKSLLDYVAEGGGLVGCHFAIGANRRWPEFADLLGATFTGHPWNEEVGVLVEEPDHPLVAAFGGKDFRIADEIYQFGPPYSRERLRVLLSLDTARTNMGVKWIGRDDDDFAQAWVKSRGKGRVLYAGFGHRTEIWWHPGILSFYLDAIQFAAGDIEAPTAPRESRPVHRAPGPTPSEVRAAKMRAAGVREPTAEEIARIEAAAPESVPVGHESSERPQGPGDREKPETSEKPDKPRKTPSVLVWGRSWTHTPNPFAEAALEALARKTGAFRVVVSDDPRLLLGDRLPRFDALVMNNIHEPSPFLPDDMAKLDEEEAKAARQFDAAVKASILEYVRGGKGIVGIHAATAALQGWPEYGEMMGGFYAGHIHEDVAIRVEDPAHPVVAAFGGKPLEIRDEIYIFGKPYSRESLRVLASLDLSGMKDPGKRPDGDYAVSWVRAWGEGRVFYTTLGHEPSTYWHPAFLRHLLAGVLFAAGDLEGETAPRGRETGGEARP